LSRVKKIRCRIRDSEFSNSLFPPGHYLRQLGSIGNGDSAGVRAGLRVQPPGGSSKWISPSWLARPTHRLEHCVALPGG
jgi:hypothetical protein